VALHRFFGRNGVGVEEKWKKSEKIAGFSKIKHRKSLTDWKQYVTIRNAVVTN
jgi:hypothetical protein